MDKSTQEIIDCWRIELNMGEKIFHVDRHTIEEIVKYFEDIDNFANSIRH